MSIVLSTLPFVVSDPTAFASFFGLVGGTLAWMVLKAIEQGRRP